jgi:hypothetical protein
MFLGRQPHLRYEGFPTFQILSLSLEEEEEEEEKEEEEEEEKTRGPSGLPVYP